MFYEIPPDVALTTCIQLDLKSTQKAISETPKAFAFDPAPQTKRGSSRKHFQKAHLSVFSKKRTPGGGGGLPDFTRRGTNYLHITLLKKYQKSNFLDSRSMLLQFRAPRIGGVLTKTFSKGSFTRFLQKEAPRGGGAFYQISPDVALTTCIQLYSESTRKAFSGRQRHVF